MRQAIFCRLAAHSPVWRYAVHAISVVTFLSLTGCFGLVSDPARHYYTLHLEPLRPIPTPKMPGLIRVRDLDSESAYDRFQIVIRRSPFELVYRQKDVWAVKPNRMVSDIIARGLANQNVFSSVTRELSERRPQYFMSGELHAIEVYDSGNTWFAHLVDGAANHPLRNRQNPVELQLR